jgi:hypothetical protein
MLHLEQVLPPASGSRELVEAGAIGLIVGAGKLWDYFHGRRARADATANGKKLDRISTAVDKVELDVRDLRAFVVGPDGQNGLRSDVRELKSRVDGIEERERDRPRQTYDRRAST